MYKTNFFFYNNLKDINIINKVESDNIINDGYITIEKYCKEHDILILGYKHQLAGKFVSFNSSLQDILDKLNQIPNIRYENKSRYKMQIVDVYTNSLDSYKAYVIY